MQEIEGNDEIKKIKENFERTFSINKELNYSFFDLIRKLMDEQKANDGTRMRLINSQSVFTEITGLGKLTYYRLRGERDKNYKPSLATLITVAIIYNLEFPVVETLRESYGRRFDRQDRVEQAYVTIVTECCGKSLNYCNKVLREIGISERFYLGDREIVEDED